MKILPFLTVLVVSVHCKEKRDVSELQSVQARPIYRPDSSGYDYPKPFVPESSVQQPIPEYLPPRPPQVYPLPAPVYPRPAPRPLPQPEVIYSQPAPRPLPQPEIVYQQPAPSVPQPRPIYPQVESSNGYEYPNPYAAEQVQPTAQITSQSEKIFWPFTNKFGPPSNQYPGSNNIGFPNGNYPHKFSFLDAIFGNRNYNGRLESAPSQIEEQGVNSIGVTSFNGGYQYPNPSEQLPPLNLPDATQFRVADSVNIK